MPAKCATAIAALTLGAAPGDAVTTSGLRGVVTRSPTKPVCEVGVPCSAPAKNTPLSFVRGVTIVKTRTDGTGHYHVSLATGWWTVRTRFAPRIGSGIKPRAVRVLAGRFRVVNFDIDTGIR